MDKKEELKRQNYFDFKRDEFMAMNEYLQSPISEIDLQKMNEGGMMTMENMTMPIGYQEGGVVPRSRQQSVMEEEARQTEGGPLKKMGKGLMSIINNIRENAFAPERREDGGAEYMKMFNFLWDKGYSQPQIDAILSGEIEQDKTVPARENLNEKFKG
jgi:hypothetical protein|tara:strand:- start:30 stop:503 length:474 start_codon:yes stop_codon:yes gene_type:complete